MVSRNFLGLFAVSFLISTKLTANCESGFRNVENRLRPGALVYYAHPLSQYDRVTEKRDLGLLKKYGLGVINPNDRAVEAQFRATRDFSIFTELALKADAVVMRSFRDGKIGAGVAKEALVSIAHGKQAFEIRPGLDGRLALLPILKAEIEARALSIDETRSYLKVLGIPARVTP